MKENRVVTFSNLMPRNDWSRRHLNWALVLYSSVLCVICVASMVFGSLANPEAYVYYLYSAMIPYVVFLCYLCVWNLRHKGRSLWNLLYLLIPQIGGIIFLCVRSRVQLVEDRKGEDRKEEK